MDKQFAPTTEEILSDIRDLIVGIYIQQLRIYDVLTLMSSRTDEQKTEELITLHESGIALCPEPALKPEN